MDIKFTLQEHGWLDILILQDGHELCIPASYLSDSIREMIVSLSIFLEGNPEIIFKFQTEPGEYRFRIKSNNNICLFEVYEFKDTFSKEGLDKGQCVISTEIDSKKLINIFYKEILRPKEIQKDEFKDRWRYEFPQDAFDRLFIVRKKCRS